MDSNPSCAASSRPILRSVEKRRIWSKQEEEVLILALKEIIQEGWNCENGFRVGYLNQLEKIMRQHFPQTDLRGDPHIGNKIHVWKKHHGSIQCMLSRSSFSWDNKQNMVVFDEESTWEEYVKTNKHAKGMENKSYLLYSTWCEVFESDHATGEHAEDLHAAAVNPLDEGGENLEDECAGDNGQSGENDISSHMQAPGKNNGKSNKRSRWSMDKGLGEQLVNLVGKFCEQTNHNLQVIASHIGYDFELSGKHAKLFEELGSLGVLNQDQQIHAAKILAKNKDKLELFSRFQWRHVPEWLC